MNIRIHPSALRETRWHEYLIRFVFGGLATVATGAIANVFGPETGGVFLAFPAIFSASATLIEKHERERKEKMGLRGERRGKEAAALDAAGAALGSLGLLVFGAAIWLLAPRSAWLALIVGSAAWFAVSIFLWSIRRWILGVSMMTTVNGRPN
jgi:TctA family transporter